MNYVRPKKSLGQHFLIDQNIARKIVESLNYSGNILEIGPGKGMLTKYLLEKYNNNLKIIEIDKKGTWFYHASGKMLINGSIKHRNQTPSPLPLNEVVAIIKDIYA